jgi:superfamily II RNA helicase
MARPPKRYRRPTKPRRPIPRTQPIKPGTDKRLKRVFAQIGVPEQVPFQADTYQLEALSAIERSDCLVTAPTGAGKTWIAREAIGIRLHAEQRAWYACPLKALSNAKYHEFCAHFGADQVGILTGDRRENAGAPVLVGTTEILRNQLYDAMHQGQSLATSLVVLDEAHFMGDSERGVVWEEIMIYLPARIALLLLSATIGNAPQIAAWLESLRRQPCRVIAETHRPVPLYPLFFHPSGTLMPLKNRHGGKKRRADLYKPVAVFAADRRRWRGWPPGKLPPVAGVVQVLRCYNLLPAIFFMKSRADCDRAVQRYARSAPRLPSPRLERLGHHIDRLTNHSAMLAAHRHMADLRQFAVGAHHGGQLPGWKLVLERLMTRGLLDVVFATSTVAAGVNFPARTIVMLNSDRFDGARFAPLNATELHQMTGRAGRRGKDNIGFVLLLPGKYMDLKGVAALLERQPANIDSQIQVNFSMVLNLLLSHTPEQVEDLYQHAFAAWQLRRSAKRERESQTLLRDFRRHRNFLQAQGYLDPDGAPTSAGTWAARLRVDQPLLIAEGLRRGCFPDRDPILLAAVMAALIFDRESSGRKGQPLLEDSLQGALLKTLKSLSPFVKRMRSARFFVRPFNPEPAAAIYAWLNGQEWGEVCASFDITDGDLASLALRTADTLRHIEALADPFPEEASSAQQAIELLLRPPLTDDLL